MSKKPCGEYHPLPCALDVECPETRAINRMDATDILNSLDREAEHPNPDELESVPEEEWHDCLTPEGNQTADEL